MLLQPQALLLIFCARCQLSFLPPSLSTSTSTRMPSPSQEEQEARRLVRLGKERVESVSG